MDEKRIWMKPTPKLELEAVERSRRRRKRRSFSVV